MKNKLLLFAIPLATVCVVSSCKKKPEPAAPVNVPSTTAVTPAEPQKPVEPIVPAMSPTDRAARLGFAQMLTKDTETLMLFQNGAEVAKRFKGSKMYSFIKAQNPGIDPEDAAEEVGGIGAADYMGTEFFLATGKSTALQSENLTNLSNRLSYYQLRNSVQMMVKGLTNPEGMEEIDPMSWMSDFVKDPQGAISILEKSEMPPIIVGFKSTPENKEKIEQSLASFTAQISQAGSSAEEIKFEVEGREFAGTQLSGQKLADELQADEDMMESFDTQFGASTRQDLFKAIAKKNLIAVSGLVNDYAIIFIGSRKEDFKLASTPSDSLAASPALAFVDSYLDKNPVGILYSQKGVLQAFSKGGGLANMAKALRDGISGNGKIDTREIEALLDIIGEREKDLTSLTQYSDFGAVAMLDEGFKFETFGGTNMPNIQGEQANKLGDIGKTPDVALFANWSSNPAYNTKMKGYMEALVETSYAVAKNASAWDIKENEQYEQFRGYFTMFEENFSKDAVVLWDAVSTDLAGGLGNETALIIDLNGEMPPLPDVPQELVKDGKFPRISLIQPVKDRAKLAAAWDKINLSGESIMKQVSKMSGTEQAMLKPMDSTKGDMVTWFFSGVLIFTNDFNPSVTLNDKWFVASTSKTHALDIAGVAEKSNSGHTGAWMSMDFDALRGCATHWLGAIEKNKDAVFKENTSAAEDFTSNQKMIKDGIDALQELDQLTIHAREEAGTARSSIHLKTHKN